MSGSYSQAMPKGFDTARIRQHMAESRSNFESLEQEWDHLISEHENEWVVAYKGQFLFGLTVPAVLAVAKREKWPLDVIAIDRLTKKRATVLL